ncbi:hypothetical protein KM92DES2_11389 [uncultured Desulfovibrio sp.]|uniref:Uncharacterized protein n=1 Tax=uncultured Desulfovibrio sp. TaxID=167968 RepID=A0A212JMJ6_9BACT|nr:hypothetical protein KM92DES2_11389 [uncultured Desulfovibrio sp.]
MVASYFMVSVDMSCTNRSPLRLHQHPLLSMVNAPLLASVIGQDHGENGPTNRSRTAVFRIVINPEVGRERRRNHSARWCQLPGVSEECSLTHTGKSPVPLNVEFRWFDSQFQEVNCHRQQLVLIRQPGIMLGRTGKHMSDAAGEALDMLAAQFFLLEWCICRYH